MKKSKTATINYDDINASLVEMLYKVSNLSLKNGKIVYTAIPNEEEFVLNMTYLYGHGPMAKPVVIFTIKLQGVQVDGKYIFKLTKASCPAMILDQFRELNATEYEPEKDLYVTIDDLPIETLIELETKILRSDNNRFLNNILNDTKK